VQYHPSTIKNERFNVGLIFYFPSIQQYYKMVIQPHGNKSKGLQLMGYPQGELFFLSLNNWISQIEKSGVMTNRNDFNSQLFKRFSIKYLSTKMINAKQLNNGDYFEKFVKDRFRILIGN